MAEIFVQKGYTLSKYAQLYGVSVKEIADASGISNPNNIQEGQKIIIPEPSATKEVAGLDVITVNNASQQKVKEQKFKNTISKNINIPSENLSIHKDSKGRKYLKISRPENSTDSENYNFGKIKENLKLKDNVLYNNNGKRQGLSKTANVFDAASVRNMDSLSIAPNHYLLVPLSEIGQKQEEKGIIFKTKVDSPKNIELKQAVQDYLD